jgi:hypothetical protein
MTGWRLKAAAVALATSVAVPAMARAEEYPETAGWGALAVLANIGYMPAKTISAGVGGLTGGLAYVCTGGSTDTATQIWEKSLGGTYVLTPSMVRGDQTIAFAGGDHAGKAQDLGYPVYEGSAPAPEPTVGNRGEERLPPS